MALVVISPETLIRRLNGSKGIALDKVWCRIHVVTWGNNTVSIANLDGTWEGRASATLTGL